MASVAITHNLCLGNRAGGIPYVGGGEMKFAFFVISKKQWHQHHPDKEQWPEWVLDLPQSLHMVVNAIQRLKSTDENLAIIRSFLDSVDYEYLRKRRQLDEGENNGQK